MHHDCQSLSAPTIFRHKASSATSAKNECMSVSTAPARKFDMRPKEFADLLGISQQQACDWRREGVGPSWIRLPGGKAIRYDRASVDRFLEERRQVPMSKDDPSDEQELAALTVLQAVQHRINNDGEAMVKTLRGTGRQVSLRLCEATEIIAHLLKHSDRPEQALTALRQSVSED